MRRADITGATLTSRARWPVAVWLPARGFVSSLDGGATFSDDKGDALAMDLGTAYWWSEGEPMALFEPVNCMELDLPLPPSVNALFVEAAGRQKGRGRQRVKTREYRSWWQGCGVLVAAAAARHGRPLQPGNPIFAENFGLHLRLDLDHKSDITNRIKAIEDLLVACHLTTGDQWNDCCLVERDRSVPAGMARVLIYSLPE